LERSDFDMSFSVQITDTATPRLASLGLSARGPAVRRVMGGGVAAALRKHFARLEQERKNRLRGKRTHFWAEVRQGVQQPALTEGGILVTINHVGAAQRYYGGTIRPTKKKWIAVPARAEAYGRRPEEFSDLHFVFLRGDLAALVQAEGDTGRRSIDAKGAGGGVFWWLKKRVYQKPDPSVLPSSDELQAAATEAGNEHVRTLMLRKLEK
jgi:hypothetical protein